MLTVDILIEYVHLSCQIRVVTIFKNVRRAAGALFLDMYRLMTRQKLAESTYIIRFFDL